MKKIFELNYKTEDNHWHNLLYANKKDALEDLENNYFIGAVIGNQIIEYSFVTERTLF